MHSNSTTKDIYRLILFFVVFCSALMFCQQSIAQQRKVALFDNSTRNAETNQTRLRSCQWLLNTAGVEYTTTTNLATALTYPIVLFTPIIQGSTFTSSERTSIANYVNNGGIIICSSVQTSTMNALLGVSAYLTSSARRYFNLNTSTLPWLVERITDPNELTTRFGPETGTSCNSRSYTLSTGISLGLYEDNKTALLYNHYGQGYAYTFGLDFRDVVHRFQINDDGNAQRTYSNGFEPGSDVFMLLIQNLVRHHIPNTVRLHTSPGCSSSSVIITHDFDSRTCIDSSRYFVNMEYSRGVRATYNITTRYFADSWLSAFYNDAFSSVEYIKLNGHILGSHSVGHFPDFAKTSVFPIGLPGLTQATYHPAYNNNVTTGGTVFGEVEVSKRILETNHGISIKTFRSGHLGYNKRQPYALAQSGYRFNSSFSANDVLNNFPFYTTDNLSYSGVQQPVLEIPMTISDASTQFPISSSNYPSVVAIWTSVTRKNDANNAPTVLLVHPNRVWKVSAETIYLDSLPPTATIIPMEEFGEFWQKRDTLDFYSTLTNNVLNVFINTNDPDSRISFIIDNASQLAGVNFFRQNGQPLYLASSPWTNGATIFCGPQPQQFQQPTSIEENQNTTTAIVYPNPSSSIVYINMESAVKGNYTLTIYDALGQNSINMQQTNLSADGRLTFTWNVEQLTTGCYFFSIQSEKMSTNGKLMVVH